MALVCGKSSLLLERRHACPAFEDSGASLHLGDSTSRSCALFSTAWREKARGKYLP